MFVFCLKFFFFFFAYSFIFIGVLFGFGGGFWLLSHVQLLRAHGL